ncbi:hypothetical protein P879_09627 [Paragonimus westermani]|uniref:Leishmanolysin-like peptidase n=1 Tax=Paragonimus westermani TaxID=34504 RepID=A0A8T0DLI8_9TREM|nr:hypothetical protein P879_09627 [Paragonimus westermani]
MSGSILKRAVVSKFTLAFFHDSGWYDVDMSQAEPLTWGQNLGCDFVLKSCYEYMEIQKRGVRNATTSPWCNESVRATEVTPSTDCSDAKNQVFLDRTVNNELQHYGSDSICINHDPNTAWLSSWRSKVTTFPTIRATCHKVSYQAT